MKAIETGNTSFTFVIFYCRTWFLLEVYRDAHLSTPETLDAQKKCIKQNSAPIMCFFCVFMGDYGT